MTPHHSRRGEPGTGRREPELKIAGHMEPAALLRAIRPEGEIHFVGHHARGRLEVPGAGERAGVGEGRGQGLASGAAGDESQDAASVEVREEHVAVAGIGSEGADTAFAEQAFDLGGARGGTAEGPDVAADIVGEDVGPGELGEAGAAIDEAAGDGATLGRAAAMGIRVQRRDVLERGVGGETGRSAGASGAGVRAFRNGQPWLAPARVT